MTPYRSGSSSSSRSTAAPVTGRERITTLDAVRGVAVLGILTMNAVSYGLSNAAYLNLDAGGTVTWLDWLIGGAGEVLFDQKFMGLFSLLFGAGIVLFADRAEAKGRRAGWFSLWRNILLALIGLAHMAFWEGDILVLYAVCAPLVILLRHRRPVTLLVTGIVIVLSATAISVAVQGTVDDPASQLGGGKWFDDGTTSDAVGLWFLYHVFARGLGMMLIGVALYRLGVLSGARDRGFYRRMAIVGFAAGLPLAALGLVLVASAGFSADVALIGSMPNTFATIPMVLGYLGAITLWDAGTDSPLRRRVRAVGRMALSNYLAQTVLGLVLLRGLFEPEHLTRSGLAVFVLAVWALQLWWSQAWLERFRYGPAEWLWRVATYRRWQPLRVSSPRLVA